MPKRNAAHISDDFVVSDDDDGVATTLPKKAKLSDSVPTPAVLDGAQKTDDNGDTYWELNAKGTRRVTISEFKGRKMVNLREHYEKDGKMLPGKKGISLVMEQFSAFLQALPQIDAALRAGGESIPRPDYDNNTDASAHEKLESSLQTKDHGEAGEGNTQVPRRTKANYEDTSDEESMLK